MAELERQASFSESPDSIYATPMNHTRRSITSSALTSLLPIAAASGVVRANYNTPKISFYSPSGNLIQPEGSSSPEFSKSASSSPTRPPLYHNETKRSSAHKTLSATACSPPARPTLVPLTTLPAITAPLPSHLMHHHNYRHKERSQIDPCESVIESAPPVKGCGGVVRPRSSPPHTGITHPSHKTTTPRSQHRCRSTRSLIHDLRSDASFYKSRYIALACSPAPRRRDNRKTLHKRPVTKGPASALRPKLNSTRAVATEQKRRAAPIHKHEKIVLGPRAGHVLRICFCQPYDGAGTSSMFAGHKKKEDLHVELEGVARPVDHTTERRSKARRPHDSIRAHRGGSAGAAA